MINNNGSPTPRRYTSSRPDLYNYEDRDQDRYMNPREKLIPREYYENVRTVDELLSEIKMLSRQLREQQDRELKLRNLCETLKGKLSKYFQFRELAFKYKQQRDELSYKLYKKNIYTDTDTDDSDDEDLAGFEVSNLNKNSNDDQIYISKRKNNIIHNRNNNNKSSISSNKSESNNKNDNDSETKELINKLYEMITSLKQTNITMSPQSNDINKSSSDSGSSSSNNNNTNNKSKYLSERDLDIIKTEELKKLEDAVQEYRHKLEAKKAYERRKISAQQEILQIQEELKNLDTGFGSIDNNNTNNNTKHRVKFTESGTRNESIRPKSRNKSTVRERFDNIGNEFDETSFFQTNST